MSTPNREVDYATKSDIDIIRAEFKQQFAELELRINDRMAILERRIDLKIDEKINGIRNEMRWAFGLVLAAIIGFGVFG